MPEERPRLHGAHRLVGDVRLTLRDKDGEILGHCEDDDALLVDGPWFIVTKAGYPTYIWFDDAPYEPIPKSMLPLVVTVGTSLRFTKELRFDV